MLVGFAANVPAVTPVPVSAMFKEGLDAVLVIAILPDGSRGARRKRCSETCALPRVQYQGHRDSGHAETASGCRRLIDCHARRAAVGQCDGLRLIRSHSRFLS